MTELKKIHSSDGGKVTMNIIAAALLCLASLWLALSDIRFPADAMFQTSSSVPLVAAYCFLLFLLTLVLSVFPKRFVFTANLLAALRLALGFPLNSFLSNAAACKIVSVALLVVAVLYLLYALRPRGIRRPWVSWKHSLGAVGLWILLALLTLPILFGGFTKGIGNLIGHYSKFTTKGITLKETVLEKDDKKVFLIGMMHIGQGEFYENLNRRMAKTPEGGGKRIVLTEGVSDRENILPENFSSGETYRKFAERFGLAQQGDHTAKATNEAQQKASEKSTSEKEEAEPATPEERAAKWAERGIDMKNADMDVSDLAPEHQELLVEILNLLDTLDFAAFFTPVAIDISGPELEDLFLNGLLGTRNDALMKCFEEHADGYNEIYIPWGAAHLTDIEQRLIEMGYAEVSSEERMVVDFSKIGSSKKEATGEPTPALEPKPSLEPAQAL